MKTGRFEREPIGGLHHGIRYQLHFCVLGFDYSMSWQGHECMRKHLQTHLLEQFIDPLECGECLSPFGLLPLSSISYLKRKSYDCIRSPSFKRDSLDGRGRRWPLLVAACKQSSLLHHMDEVQHIRKQPPRLNLITPRQQRGNLQWSITFGYVHPYVSCHRA